MTQRSEQGPHQEHLTTTRTARIALLGDATPVVRELWIACHGFGQLAHRFLKPFTAVAAPHRLIVAPEALNRFYLDGRMGPHGPDSAVGATWMTREDRLTEIEDYVRYLDQVAEHLRARLEARDVRVVALGFSQGVATICRWAAHTGTPIHALVLWAGSLPPELEPRSALFGSAKLFLVAGDEDSFMSPAQHAAYAEQLSAAGLDTVQLTYRGGHRIDRDALAALARELDFR
jgi:predicted esterase